MPELLPGVHIIDGVSMDLAGAMLPVRPILIDEGGRLTLIDTGPSGSEAPIRAYLEGIGHRIEEIERILVTHHHVDHTGALARIARDADAIVAAHADEVAILERRVPEPTRPMSREGLRAMGVSIGHSQYALERERDAGFVAPAVKITEELHGGDILPILGGLVVLHDPGHSPGHIAFYNPTHDLLFAADLFHYDGYDLHIPLPVFTEDAGRAVESLRAIVETCDFDIAIPYHGVPLQEGASEKLRRALSGVAMSVGHSVPGQALSSG